MDESIGQIRTISVKTGNGSVETKVTETHVVQVSEGSYTSIPIPAVSAIEHESKPLPFWLALTVAAGLAALILLGSGLETNTAWPLITAVPFAVGSWFAFQRWSESRSERLIVRSSGGTIEVGGETRTRDLLLDLVAEIEERQGPIVRA